MNTGAPLARHRRPALALAVAAVHAGLLVLLLGLNARLPLGEAAERVAAWPDLQIVRVVRVALLTPQQQAQQPSAAPPRAAATTAHPAAVSTASSARVSLPRPLAAAHADTPSATATTAADEQATAAAPELRAAVSFMPPPATAPAAPVPPATPAPITLAHPDHAHCPPAPYPTLLRERGIEGLVRVQVRVNAQGRAAEARLAAGSGFRLFDEAALQRALACRFVPARRGDEAIEGWVDFPVRFALVG